MAGTAVGQANGVQAKKRVRPANDVDGAARDKRRQLESANAKIRTPPTAPAPAPGSYTRRLEASSSRPQPQSRPPNSTVPTALFPAVLRAVPGLSVAAPGGPRVPSSVSGNPKRKPTLQDGLIPFPLSRRSAHVSRLSFSAQTPHVPSAKYEFKAANRATGVSHDEGSSGSGSESGSSEDDEDEIRAVATSSLRKGARQFDNRADSKDGSSTDSLSETQDSSEDDSDGGYVDPPHNQRMTRRQILGGNHSKDDVLEPRPTQAKSSRGMPKGLSTQDDRSSKELYFTPAGKPYNMYKNDDGDLIEAYGALFPDNYRLQHLAAFPDHPFICPVRRCRQLFRDSVSLVKHFSASHSRCHFNDNLDEYGTLSVCRKVDSGRSIVVARRPSRSIPPGLPSLPNTSRWTKFADAIGDSPYTSVGSTKPEKGAPPSRHEPKSITLTESSASGPSKAKTVQLANNIPRETFSVEAAGLNSDVWNYIKPFIKQRWLASFQNELQRSAFLQAISLPKRNDIDKTWLDTVLKAHQKAFKTLFSIALHVIGVKGECCTICQWRAIDRRRNCVILPQEAEDMRDLREALGTRCVNCFFFPTMKPCKFAKSGNPIANASAVVKPIPASIPAPPPHHAIKPAKPPAKPLPVEPPVAQPVSQSAVPLPVLPGQSQVPHPQISQPQVSNDRLPTARSGEESVRRSGRIFAREPDAIKDSHGLDTQGDGDASLAQSSDAASNDEPASTTSTAVASSSASAAPLPSKALVGKAFRLFSEISELPAHEQNVVYDKVAMMWEIAKGAPIATGSAASGNGQGDIRLRQQIPAADGWEIAPGRLASGGEAVAFSTSFLRRETVGLISAQYVTASEKILNKHIAALDHLRLEPVAGWDCKFTVMKGLIQVRVGDVEAKLGQGGVLLVKNECLVTNITHDESQIQVWWKKVVE